MLNGAPVPPCCKPSAAANFIGCSRAIVTPLWSPVPITTNVAIMPAMLATLIERNDKSVFRFLSKNQQLTPNTNTAPVIQPLDMV